VKPKVLAQAMMTYTTPAAKAASLRRQLLWSNLAFFALWLLWSAVAKATLETESGMAALGIVSIPTVLVAIWATIVDYRTAWHLWRWQGALRMLACSVVGGYLDVRTEFVGTFVIAAFLLYLYAQVGKQVYAPQASREVFES